MTSFVRSTGIAAALLLLGAVQNASAQIIEPITFTTSFPFTVGDATVPAGRYTVRQDDDNPTIFELTGAHTTVLFQTRDAAARETPAKSEVVFKRYGDGYVLKSIWLEGLTSGAETLASEGERHVTKHHGVESEQRVPARKGTAAASRNR